MSDLQESIRSAISRTRTERELPANVLAAMIDAGYVPVRRDVLLRAYGALMAMGKKTAALGLFEAMQPDGGEIVDG